MNDMAVIRTSGDLDNDPRLVKGPHGYYLKTNPDCLYAYVPGGLADRPRRWHVDVMSEEFQRAFRSELSSLLLIVFVAGAVLACGVLILLGWWVVR